MFTVKKMTIFGDQKTIQGSKSSVLNMQITINCHQKSKKYKKNEAQNSNYR